MELHLRKIYCDLLESKLDDLIKTNPELQKLEQPLRIRFDTDKYKKYLNFIVKYLTRFGKQDFTNIEDEDLDIIQSTLEEYDELVKRNKIVGKDKDISHFVSLNDLRDAIERAKKTQETKAASWPWSHETEEMKQHRKEIEDGSKKIYEDSGYLLVQILTKEAAIYFGNHFGGSSKWCISGEEYYQRHPNVFKDHINVADIYFLFVKSKKTKFAIVDIRETSLARLPEYIRHRVGNKIDMVEVRDDKNTLIHPFDLINQLPDKINKVISEHVAAWNDILVYFENFRQMEPKYITWAINILKTSDLENGIEYVNKLVKAYDKLTKQGKIQKDITEYSTHDELRNAIIAARNL